MSHVDAAAAGEGEKLFKDPDIEDVTITKQANYSPPPTPVGSRPQTPDSAYGEVGEYTGTTTNTTTPPRGKLYGAESEDAPGSRAEDPVGLDAVRV